MPQTVRSVSSRRARRGQKPVYPGDRPSRRLLSHPLVGRLGREAPSAAEQSEEPERAVDRDPLADHLAVDLDGCFEELVLTYQGRLYSFALRMTGNREDAEEVAQDAFVRAYRALVGYDEERVRALALRPWLYQITLNVARNRLRRRRPRLLPLESSDGAGPEPEDDERTRPEVVAARREGDAELGALVAALPTRYRAAVVLRHVEGLSYDEAATALGRPVGTVKSNVHRGLRLLREAMGNQMGEAR